MPTKRKYSSPEAYAQVRRLRSEAAILKKNGLISKQVNVRNLAVSFPTRGPSAGTARIASSTLEKRRLALTDVVKGEARAQKLTKSQIAAIERIRKETPEQAPRVVAGRAVIRKTETVTKTGQVKQKKLKGLYRIPINKNWEEKVRRYFDENPDALSTFSFGQDGGSMGSYFHSNADDMIAYLSSDRYKIAESAEETPDNRDVTEIYMMTMEQYNALIMKEHNRREATNGAYRRKERHRTKRKPMDAVQKARHAARQKEYRKLKRSRTKRQ